MNTLAIPSFGVEGVQMNWYDIVAPRGADDRYTEMEEADWSEFKTELYVNAKGRDAVMAACEFAERVDALRRARVVQQQAKEMPNYWAEFRMWLDMVNEPAKYGDDIVDFTEIDDKLAVSAARWRLNAEWLRKEDELKEAEESIRVVEAATKIQAAFRGHLVRDLQMCLNCEHCLSHRISPYTVAGEHVCAACYDEWVFG
jgi:hypothetical protein